MAALEDEQTQKNGIVFAIFSIGDALRKPFDAEAIMQTSKLYNALPMRFGGIHWCFEEKNASILFPSPITIVQLTMGLKYRARFRAHNGK